MTKSIYLSKTGRNVAEAIFDIDARMAFIALCIFSFSTITLQRYFILTDDIYFNSLAEQLAYDRIEMIVNTQKKYMWLTYALTPLLLAIQIFLITICLNIGVLLKEDKVVFKKLFSMVTKALIVHTFFKFINIFIIYFFYNIKSIEDLSNVFSFSVMNFFDAKKIPTWLQYPLSTISLVEIIFWFILAYGIRLILNLNFKSSISFVSYTYGIGLVLWVLFVVFLQVNFTM